MRDVILHLPRWLTYANNDSSPSTAAPRKFAIVYFITGNPGLIAYYEAFLKLLAEGSGNNAVIAGASLGGFGASYPMSSETNLEDELLHPPFFSRKPIYNLKDQVKLTHDRLNALVKRLQTDYPITTGVPFEVVLMGHSVGAYIALETVRLHNSAVTSQHFDQTSSFKIAATMLLTPTIVDISYSPSGKVATPILSTIPFIPALLQLSTNTLTGTMPMSWLTGIVSRVTGMKYGSRALEATVTFLRTAGAVKQALHMARCEMAEIGKEEWREEVWGMNGALSGEELKSLQDTVEGGREDEHTDGYAGKSSTYVEILQAKEGVLWKAPMHYFLFAKEDRWVADATRDEIVKAMGSRNTIVVDEPRHGEKGLVHAWCLEQSDVVAEIVNGWLRELIRQD